MYQLLWHKGLSWPGPIFLSNPISCISLTLLLFHPSSGFHLPKAYFTFFMPLCLYLLHMYHFPSKLLLPPPALLMLYTLLMFSYTSRVSARSQNFYLKPLVVCWEPYPYLYLSTTLYTWAFHIHFKFNWARTELIISLHLLFPLCFISHLRCHLPSWHSIWKHESF